MTAILDRIIDIHKDPKLLVTQSALSDKEINPNLLGHFVEEDKDAWFIKSPQNRQEYILYCKKKPGGPKDLEILLQELWARYTRKRLNPDIEWGFRV